MFRRRQHRLGRVAAVHRQPPRAARAGLSDLHRGRRELLAEESAVRAGTAPAQCAAAPARRLTAAEIQAHRDYRQVTRPADLEEVDGHRGRRRSRRRRRRLPGLLSDISLNDGGGGRAAFGRRDTPSAANGSPTIVIPRRNQRTRTADQHPAAGTRVGRRKAGGLGVRVRAGRQRCGAGPCRADDGAGAPLRSRQVRV